MTASANECELSTPPQTSKKSLRSLSIGVVSRGDRNLSLWLQRHQGLMTAQHSFQWLIATQRNDWLQDFHSSVPKSVREKIEEKIAFFDLKDFSVNQMRLYLQKHSTADIHLFIDDDVYVSLENLEKILEIHNLHSDMDSLGGMYESQVSSSYAAQGYNLYCNSWLVSHSHTRLKFSKLGVHPFTSSVALGGNWSVKRRSSTELNQSKNKISRLEGDERELFHGMNGAPLILSDHNLSHQPQKTFWLIAQQIILQTKARNDLPEFSMKKINSAETCFKISAILKLSLYQLKSPLVGITFAFYLGLNLVVRLFSRKY